MNENSESKKQNRATNYALLQYFMYVFSWKILLDLLSGENLLTYFFSEQSDCNFDCVKYRTIRTNHKSKKKTSDA